jgi:hypothetical protein
MMGIMKRVLFVSMVIAVVTIMLMSVALADDTITAYYRGTKYVGTLAECREQAAADYGGYACDYIYLGKTKKLYNIELHEDKRQYNLDAYGIDIDATPSPEPSPTPAPTAKPTAKPTVKLTATPTATPRPTLKPSANPTTQPQKTAKPTAKPSSTAHTGQPTNAQTDTIAPSPSTTPLETPYVEIITPSPTTMATPMITPITNPDATPWTTIPPCDTCPTAPIGRDVTASVGATGPTATDITVTEATATAQCEPCIIKRTIKNILKNWKWFASGIVVLAVGVFFAVSTGKKHRSKKV